MMVSGLAGSKGWLGGGSGDVGASSIVECSGDVAILAMVERYLGSSDHCTGRFGLFYRTGFQHHPKAELY